LAESFTDTAEARLRDDILNSVFNSGEKLRVEEISRRYAIGATPVREALSRLLTDGLVELSNNKGFRVPPLSYDDLLDLSVTRGIIESEAVRNAMQNRSEEWEIGLMSAMERLRRRARADLEELSARQAFFDAHHDFHAALLAGCRLKRLLVMQSWLEQQQSRYYRRLPFSNPWSKSFVAEHELLMTSALSGNAEKVAGMLRNHTMKTIETLTEMNLFNDTPKKTPPKSKNR
jgi:GntR family transcriptional regulator, carbon starvation induced regulator